MLAFSTWANFLKISHAILMITLSTILTRWVIFACMFHRNKYFIFSCILLLFKPFINFLNQIPTFTRFHCRRKIHHKKWRLIKHGLFNFVPIITVLLNQLYNRINKIWILSHHWVFFVIRAFIPKC